MCIGATFAMTEIKLVLAMLLQRYRPSVPPEAQIDWHMRVTLAPRIMPMLLEAQDRQFGRQAVRGNIHELVDLR
jgi:cytochrome P450